MAMVVEAVGPPRLRDPSPTAFQALARSIIFQQLSGKAASTILGRFVALFREGATAEDAVDGYFPEPAEVLALDAETMRAAGVSRQKAASLRDLAAHFAEGKLSIERFGEWSDEEVIEHLLSGARDRTLDGADVPDVPAAPSGRASRPRTWG